MDLADRADLQEQFILEKKIAEVRANKQQSKVPKGTCYFCDEVVAEGYVFCDADCSEDYEKLQRAELNRKRG